MYYYSFPENLSNVPSYEGIYFLSENPSDDGIVYIGRADNLRQRLSQHPDPNNFCLQNKKISYFAYEVTNESEEREQELIRYYDPECNQDQ